MDCDRKYEDFSDGHESYSLSTISSTSSASSTCSTFSTSSAFTSLSGALQDASVDAIHSNPNLLRVTRSWAYYLDGRRRYEYHPQHCDRRTSCQPNNGNSQCAYRPNGVTDRPEGNERIDDENGVSHSNHFQYTTALHHVTEASFSRPALEEIKLHGLAGVKRVFGVALFLGLIPILGPIIVTYLTYYKVYKPLLNIKIGRISRVELQQTMQIYLFLDLMLGLLLPIIGPVLRVRYFQPALRVTDEAKARVLEHGEVCVRAYNQVAALIGHTSEPRSLLSNLESISIQTIPPTLPSFLSRSFLLTRHRRRPCVQPYSMGPRIMNQHQQQSLTSTQRLPSNILSFQRNQSSVRQPAATLSQISTVSFSGGGATTPLSRVTFSSIEFVYHYQHCHNPHFPYHFHDGQRVDCPCTDLRTTRSYSSSESVLEDERSRVRSSPHFSFFGSSDVDVEKETLSFEDVSKLVPVSPKSSTECIMPSTLPLLNTRHSAVQSPELSKSHLNLVLRDASEPYLRSTSTMQVVVNSGKPVLALETIPEVVIISQSECDPQGADFSMSSVLSSPSTQSTMPPPLSSTAMSLPPCPQRSLAGCGPSQAYKLYLMGHNYPLDWFRDKCAYEDQDRRSVLTLASSCQAQYDHGSIRDSTHHPSSNEHVVAVGVKGKLGCEKDDMNEMKLPSAPMFLVGRMQALPPNGFTSRDLGHSQLRRSPVMDFSILRQQRATAVESL
ncbi:MAG: hypothetical protein BYD32DRAFT_486236 [Podila humilis]|nr:MAG: hypothetical protein BYD32DRAFT_486236 [Podila humilis]